MKVSTPELTSSPLSMTESGRFTDDFDYFALDHQPLLLNNKNKNNNMDQRYQSEDNEGFVNILDYIRGDDRLPERYVFDRDLYPDYSRATQRRLVAYIQACCERQNSPVSVHQWANEEHDDRVVRRIRFRCAFFRKKKRRQGAPCCLFQFQVCYQEKYGWCLLNGKGQHRHNGHPLAISNSAGTNNQNVKPMKSLQPTASAKRSTKKAPQKLKPDPTASLSTNNKAASCMPCTTSKSSSLISNKGTCTMDCARECVAAKKESAWDSKAAPAYVDFALDTALDDMDWDLFNEAIAIPLEEEDNTPPTVSASAEGLLQKTINLSETPFPEVTNLDDKCAGIIGALQQFTAAHNFAVTVEDYFTADRPGEKTMRVVLHCLGGHCCYQVALLWVVGLTRWQIYCQPDGIFVHGCSRLEGKSSVASSAMASTPLNEAFDHLVDFLNGEVVCPDLDDEENQNFSRKAASACCWKTEDEKEVSESVRKETRKAVVKVAGVDATASAA